jgi:tripartite-type tricarboxylate transporter receptor subunit TctC
VTLRAAVAFLGLLVQPGFMAALAQQYPVKPVRVVASEAGGGGDFVARVMAPGLTAALGQQIVVENRGGGVIAGDVVARSAPDGYTLLVYGNTLWLLPLLRSQVPYDPVRDFLPLSLITRSPTVLVVHPSVPAKSVKELIALARARPGQLNYASAAPGTNNHLAAELLKYQAKVDIVRVSYRGMASALTAVMSGEAQVMFPIGAGATSQIQSGKVRALAVTSLEPSPLYPGLPTVASAGLPGFEVLALFGVFAPAKMPDAIAARLNKEIVRVMQQPDVKERLFASGVEAVGTAPEGLAAAVRDEVARMQKVIRSAGIREE